MWRYESEKCQSSEKNYSRCHPGAGASQVPKESINLEYFENTYRVFGIFSFRLWHRLLKSTKFSNFKLKYIRIKYHNNVDLRCRTWTLANYKLDLSSSQLPLPTPPPGSLFLPISFCTPLACPRGCLPSWLPALLLVCSRCLAWSYCLLLQPNPTSPSLP